MAEPAASDADADARRVAVTGEVGVRARRRRNAIKTRADILAAAEQRFARNAFARVTLKDIADDAGVTPALAVRYFGSKRALFEEVVRRRMVLAPLVAGDLDQQITARARSILEFFEDRTARAPAMALLRSLDLDDGGELFRSEFERRILEPWSIEIVGRDADVRLRLVAGLLFGVGLFSIGALTEPDRGPLGPDDAKRTVHYLAEMLRVCLQDPDATVDESSTQSDG